MPEAEWWHWAVLGFALLVLDAVLLNIYYLVWFGAGALAAAAALAVFPSMPLWAQVVLFAAASAALLALWLLLLRPRNSAAAMRRARDELPGQAGVVVNYNAAKKRGTIRMQKPVGGKDVWEFAAEYAPRPGDRAVIGHLNKNGVAVLAPPLTPPEKS